MRKFNSYAVLTLKVKVRFVSFRYCPPCKNRAKLVRILFRVEK